MLAKSVPVCNANFACCMQHQLRWGQSMLAPCLWISLGIISGFWRIKYHESYQELHRTQINSQIRLKRHHIGLTLYHANVKLSRNVSMIIPDNTIIEHSVTTKLELHVTDKNGPVVS